MTGEFTDEKLFLNVFYFVVLKQKTCLKTFVLRQASVSKHNNSKNLVLSKPKLSVKVGYI